MRVVQAQNIQQVPVDMPGSQGCRVRWLIGENVDAPNFAMREFEVQSGGYTPRHSHPYEHEVFVLAGEGTVLENNTPHPIRAGDTIYVAPDEIHQFQNNGKEPLKFLCMVPNSSRMLPVTQAPECGVENPF